MPNNQFNIPEFKYFSGSWEAWFPPTPEEQKSAEVNIWLNETEVQAIQVYTFKGETYFSTIEPTGDVESKPEQGTITFSFQETFPDQTLVKQGLMELKLTGENTIEGVVKYDTEPDSALDIHMRRSAKSTRRSARMQHCKDECLHEFNDMNFRLMPAPDYKNIDFLSVPNGIKARPNTSSLGNNHWIANIGADVPYSFTIGAVTFLGVLYIRGNSGQDSYTRGVMGGIINCYYDIKRDKANTVYTGVGIKAHLLFDFQNRHCVGWTETLGTRCVGFRNWGKVDHWYSSRPVIIASW